jgi:hypothetical protein
MEWIAGSAWRYFTLIFLLSLAIRVYELNQVPARSLIPSSDRELGAITISLMRTGQFADPYIVPTGPTAHLPPLYPILFSLIYRWLGMTSKSGYATWLFIFTVASILYGMLPWFSGKFGAGKQAGILAGLAGALIVGWHKHGEFLTGLVMGLALVVFLRRWSRGATRLGSFALGLGIGAAFHLQPALLPVMLGCIGFELWWSKKRQKILLISLMVLGIVIACLPWAWRNYTTFNTFFFIRSNLGVELRLGNHEGAAPTFELIGATQMFVHPKAIYDEAKKLQEIGEIEYMRQAQKEALEWIIANPGDFLGLALRRIAYLWVGPLHKPRDVLGVLALTLLAIWGGWRIFPRITIPQRAAILIPLITYPLIYYIVAYMPRYRVPIDWILYILAGAAVWGMITKEKE